MITSIEGKYRNGRVELMETPENVPDETQVIVVFVLPNPTSGRHQKVPTDFPLAGTVLRYDDPFGPATEPEEWEVLQ